MSNWTTIPPWLYQNDLPDEELQAVYVREAEKKWRECVGVREELEAELRDARAAEQKAATFLAQAREAQARYRGALAGPPDPDATARPRLPRPRTR